MFHPFYPRVIVPYALLACSLGAVPAIPSAQPTPDTEIVRGRADVEIVMIDEGSFPEEVAPPAPAPVASATDIFLPPLPRPIPQPMLAPRRAAKQWARPRGLSTSAKRRHARSAKCKGRK